MIIFKCIEMLLLTDPIYDSPPYETPKKVAKVSNIIFLL